MTSLKRHLMSKKHGWCEANASRALLEFGLRKNTDFTKKKVICCVCHKPVLRIGNHLRQTHKLANYKVKSAIRQCMADVVSIDIPSDATNESSEEEDRDLEMLFSKELANSDQFMQSCSDSDDVDWLGAQYVKKRSCKPNDSSDDDNNDQIDVERVNETEHHLNIDNNSFEDSEETSDVDYEDMEDRFYMSSIEEDKLLSEFESFISSRDGGSKDSRQANKHKRSFTNDITTQWCQCRF